MRLIIDGGRPLRGEVALPADKSITHRALIFNALASGRATVRACDAGRDNASTAQALAQLGVGIERRADGWVVSGTTAAGFTAPTSPLDCGNSGTTMRLLAGVLAGAGVRATLSGDASLSRRPMGRVCEPLRQLGAAIHGRREAGRELPPLQVEPAVLQPGECSLSVASAQVKSAVLLAGLTAKVAVSVHEPALSRDHSERMLAAMGATLQRQPQGDGQLVQLQSTTHLSARDVTVPGDFSSAAFWLAAGLLVPDSQVVLPAVGLNPSRTGLLEILEELGAGVAVTDWHEVAGEAVGDLQVHPETLTAWRPGQVPTRVSGAVIPRLIDELVVLAAVASQATGRTEIRDAAELRVKESDRIDETVRMLAAFGVEVTPRPDGWVIEGAQALQPARLDVSCDHRIALTAAVLACAAPGRSELAGFEVAAVSYPRFAEQLTTLGAACEVRD